MTTKQEREWYKKLDDATRDTLDTYQRMTDEIWRRMLQFYRDPSEPVNEQDLYLNGMAYAISAMVHDMMEVLDLAAITTTHNPSVRYESFTHGEAYVARKAIDALYENLVTSAILHQDKPLEGPHGRAIQGVIDLRMEWLKSGDSNV